MCETMYKLAFTLVAAMIIGSLMALVVSLYTAPITDRTGQPNRDILSAIADVVTSVLMLIISLRLVESATGFFKFSQEAERQEVAAESALQSSTKDDLSAVKLWHEYQIARATAPVLPTWVWKWRRAELDDLWVQHRKEGTEAVRLPETSSTRKE